ncbi:multidrug type major facilitator superfamily transporter [Lactobacillus hamsteri DSM 5661 = JCM 6256]|uniref:Multidrug type major facilitator superfamily transporter n=1 Tax=Lactobacillus hamsteri DSM 5661 = JCM 6256 TaxID=1423754 RepID=A0A0R1Y4J4_9LACO|nr:multidrug type major facilitator superfamily transporter [Lactobacillus hamsteri DSM 5661 = JCM 6256]
MKQLNVGLDILQWTTTGYLLMIAIIMICSSYLNERFSARQLFICACLGFMVGSLISAIAPTFYILLIGRLISALGAGLATPLMFNLIIEILPRKKWGLYMGIAGLIIAMAPTLGPVFGGAITYYMNYTGTKVPGFWEHQVVFRILH